MHNHQYRGKNEMLKYSLAQKDDIQGEKKRLNTGRSNRK